MTAWIEYCKTYAKENNIKYKEALKQASSSYKKSKETKNEKETKAETKAEMHNLKKQRTKPTIKIDNKAFEPVEPAI